MNDDTRNDVSIIGAGVAGLYALHRCISSGLSCYLFDALSFCGGQCISLYPDKKIHGVPGVYNTYAREFINTLRDPCLQANDKLFINEKITNIAKDSEFFSLNNGKFLSRYIIIATGIGEMIPNIPSEIAGINRNDDFVQYYSMNTDIYSDKNVVIAGGGDSALDFAIDLSKSARNVTIIHKKDTFSAEYRKVQEAMNIENIDIKLAHKITEIGQEERVITTDKEIFLCDYVVFCCGFRVSPCAINGAETLGVRFNKDNLINVDIFTMKTDATDIYAIGDAVSYKGKKKNLLSCFYEADKAVRIIKESITV